MSPASGEDPSITVRRAAMDALARREHGFTELLEKLAARFPELDRETVIIPALERLREENLQSDERFVESFVRARAGRGMGPLKIEAELGQRGVDAAIVQRHLRDAAHDWRRLAGRALDKKYPGAAPVSAREHQRCYRFLAGRGFASEDIRAVLSRKKGDGETVT